MSDNISNNSSSALVPFSSNNNSAAIVPAPAEAIVPTNNVDQQTDQAMVPRDHEDDVVDIDLTKEGSAQQGKPTRSYKGHHVQQRHRPHVAKDHRQQGQLQRAMDNDPAVQQSNAVYLQFTNLLANDQLADNGDHLTEERDAAVKAQLIKKREREEEQRALQLHQSVAGVAQQHGAADAAKVLQSGIADANAYVAVERTIKKAKAKADRQQNKRLAQFAVALVAANCVTPDCPHSGRRDRGGMCDSCFKAATRIPDHLDHGAREQLKMQRKIAKRDALQRRRNARAMRCLQAAAAACQP